MSLVFKIGEHSDFLPVPTNYPKCGDWLPDHDLIETQEEKKVPRSVGTFTNLDSKRAGSSASWVFNKYVLQIILYVLVRSM